LRSLKSETNKQCVEILERKAVSILPSNYCTFIAVPTYVQSNPNLKKKTDVALMYSRLQVGHCIIDDIKFEFNDI